LTQEAYDISPALAKQRRNLLIVSMAILFITVSGATFKSVNLLGIQATVSRPEAVIWFLQGLLGYFLYRYYLYLVQEPTLYVRDAYYQKLNALARPKIQAIKNRLYPEASSYGGNFELDKASRVDFFHFSVTGVIGQNKYGEQAEEPITLNSLHFIPHAIAAALFAVLNRSYFTDYFLPFAVAFLAFFFGFDILPLDRLLG
jgi:hypothetical protein